MIDYLQELNEQQRAVVTDTDSPILVLAGAGSGKTRCIIYRTAYLIREQGVPPWKILIVTFTNKAAGELQDRLEKLLSIPMRALWVGTFHSLCLRILRYESASLPYHTNFSIYASDEQKSLLKRIYKDQGFDVQKYPLNKVLSRIGRYKNRLMHPEDIDPAEYEQGTFFKGFINIYRHYQAALLLNQAMDFDDILLYTAKLLRSNDAVRAKYQDHFDYVMIDEYQDTNQAQFEIVHQIAHKHQRVCVVGDDDQAIYSFRGATLRNILEFERDYANVKAIRLEQNYRSTSAILDLANAIISKNKNRHAKELWSDLGEGLKPRLDVYEDGYEEADMVVRSVASDWQTGTDLSQLAILYRTNAQSRVFENALMQSKIPYSIVGSLHFYQRKEIKDLLAYLCSISNPDDNENLLRIINEPPRGIGLTSVGRLLGFAAKTHVSLYNTLQNVGAVQDLAAAAQKRVTAFAAKLEAWRLMLPKTPVTTIVKDIVEDLGLVQLYKKSSDPKDIARAENLIEFVASVNEFSERFQSENDRLPLLQDFLPFVALQTDMDKVSSGSESVRLMTLHNAKGLEFDTVYIVGLEDKLLPHRMSMDSREEIEEERRLFYVGVTRAKRVLRLSYARARRLYDSFEYTTPSIFITNLESKYFEGLGHDSGIPMPSYKKPGTKMRDSHKHFQIGQKVWHQEYGEGIVLGVNGVDKDAVVTVSFKRGQLLKVVGTHLNLGKTI